MSDEVFPESDWAEQVESCLLSELPWEPFCNKVEFNIVGAIGLHKKEHFLVFRRERGVDFAERAERGLRDWLVISGKGVMRKWVAIELTRREGCVASSWRENVYELNSIFVGPERIMYGQKEKIIMMRWWE